MATGAPTVSRLLTVWVGGIMTQALIEDLHPSCRARSTCAARA
jgi:hypothetical protein